MTIPDRRLQGRLVVVSPHLDDAVLSLGATMAHAAEAGANIEVLTVFAGAPHSQALTDEWDRKSGFATEGEAAQQRRREDQTACNILGVTPRWFEFGAESYERRGTPQEVIAAVVAATTGADAVLMPGFPLAHADHAALTNGLLSHGSSCRSVGLYAEQPYAFDRNATPAGTVAPMTAAGIASGTLTWQRARVESRHRQLKLQAVKQYVSQLPQLGLRNFGHLRLRRMLWHESRLGGETIAWFNST